MEPHYTIYGKAQGDRGVQVETFQTGPIGVFREEIGLKDVPKSILDSVQKYVDQQRELKGFRPLEAWREHWPLMNGRIVYLIYGDAANGTPVKVEVEAGGDASHSADTRDEYAVGTPIIAVGESIPPRGFAVLAARYGRDAHWVDVTDRVRPAVSEGMIDLLPNNFPDPAFGSVKGLAVVYSDNGKVGLSITKDGQKVELPPRDSEARYAEVPSVGFAVLAARYGSAGTWNDVTDAIRSRVSGGRVEALIPDLGLANPSPNALKTIAIAYSVEGRVGLSVTPENRPISLPLEGPPLNSSSLEVRRLEFTHEVSSVAFLPDGQQIVAGIKDGTVRVLDVATGREAHRFEGHGPGHVAVAVASSGNLVISGGEDKYVRLWDLKTGREKTIFRGHTGAIRDIALSPNGRLMASSSWDKSARIWELSSGKTLQLLGGHTEVVMGVAFTPDSRQIATTSWDQSARLWDVATGRELRKTEGDNGTIGDLALSKDGRLVYFGDKHLNLKIWEPASGQVPAAVPTSMECGWSLALFPDGRRICLTDENAAVVGT